MPLNPNLAEPNSPVSSSELRDQFNELKSLIDERVTTGRNQRGRPLGRVSTGKKVFVPNFFFIGLPFYCRKIHFAAHYPNLSFRRLIPDADRRAIACAETIRSVTHLVLARL